MQREFITLNEDRGVTLTAYLQEVGGEFHNIDRRPAILVLPGGGYQMCSDREADPVAFPYLKAGYQVFILRYSVKQDAVWPQPLEDYEQAMEMITGKAEEWKLYPKKIAVIGFSAGGHLAAAAATMGRIRPAAAILGYAVLNEDVKGCNKSAPGLIGQVDEKTPPCFLFASRTDNVVPIDNSLEFLSALSRNGVSFESHIYAYGPHGFSTCDSSVQGKETEMCDRIPRWVEDSVGWLRDVMGDFGPEGLEEPACKARINGDQDDFLSIDCTMGKLMADAGARAVLEPLLQAARQRVPGGTEEQPEELAALAKNMKLRDALGFANVPKAALDQLDEQLRRLPNGK
ncbi:MAG: alpha/beta hydrolase [Roseburia sp.]|nr:alpha/beta hydrolase [Roseburia sp.]MCM1097128.1 alpha/beta hydrolase [Ruminococcus flavefaciens]